MNPLYVLGWSEPRDHSEPRPRRDTAQFIGTVVLADHPKRTIVNVGFEATSEVTLGKNTPASVVYDTGSGTKQYVYDQNGGTWFGVSPGFAGTNGFFVRTELDPGDSISIRGFAPQPIGPRKFLLNLGPDNIVVETGDAGDGMVQGGVVRAVPNTGIKIFWDGRDASWRVMQPPDWRSLQFETLITVQADRLVIKGWPVVLASDVVPPTGPLPNQLTLAGEPLEHLGEPLIVTPG